MTSATLLAMGLVAVVVLNAWVIPRVLARPRRLVQQPLVRPAPPPGAAAMTSTPRPAVPPQPARPQSVVVLFETDQDRLDDEALAALARLGRQVAGARLLVEGHADQTGAERHNVRLSWRRAMVVAHRLEALGWPADDVVVKAHGSARPAAQGTSAEELRRNRRVEINLGSTDL
jgi:peptidoglycan-associated lipoprotein